MEMVLKEEVLDMVSIESIKTLEQADEILEACNASDGDVVETYVQNAITRGAVYHKLTEVGNGGLGLLNEEVGERYNTTKKTIGVYINIYKDGDIILRKLSASVTPELLELKPTLRSLQDTISRDPDKVATMIEYRINSRDFNSHIVNTVTRFMEDASDDIRYLFSTRNRVALGRLAKYIEEGDEAKILKTIKLNGDSEKNADIEQTKRELADENKELRRQIAELTEENEMLKRRNKFLVDSFRLSDVKKFLNRALSNKSMMRKYKPELEEAFNLLGVDTATDEKKLKKAYKEKVSVYHSDVTGDDEMFRKIIEANKLVKEYIKGL